MLNGRTDESSRSCLDLTNGALSNGPALWFTLVRYLRGVAIRAVAALRIPITGTTMSLIQDTMSSRRAFSSILIWLRKSNPKPRRKRSQHVGVPLGWESLVERSKEKLIPTGGPVSRNSQICIDCGSARRITEAGTHSAHFHFVILSQCPLQIDVVLPNAIDERKSVTPPPISEFSQDTTRQRIIRI